MKILAKILIGALGLLLVSALVPGISVSGLYIAIIASLILGSLT